MSQVEHHNSGIEYWRSLQHLADTPEVRAAVEQEFPGYDASSIATTSRRKFLKIMGASMALAGLTLTGCRRWPREKIAPYATGTGNPTPGIPEQYATTWELGGIGQGLLVTNYDGRPIKIEGNPSHPFSFVVKDKYGSADAFAQASVLELYDPQRSRAVVDRTSGQPRPSDWASFTNATRAAFKGLKNNSQGLAILCEATSSPSVLAMRKRIQAAFPQAKWYEYEPLTRDHELEGSRIAFGRAVRTRLHLDKARIVVSLDEDLLFAHPAHTRYSNDWSQWRRKGDRGEMNRVYLAESAFTVTGTIADVRLPVDPSRIPAIAQAIAAGVGIGTAPQLGEGEAKFVQAAVADLKSAGNAGVVAVGPSAAPEVHALAHAINAKLGAIGNTVTLLEDPAGDRPTHMRAILDLTQQMSAGKVAALLILGGNPLYDAPIDAQFAKALGSVPLSIHLSVYANETSRQCKWHLPRAHYLEAWGDTRAWDGTPSICQPMIQPLFDGKSIIEVLALLESDSSTTGEQIVRRTWQEQFIKTGNFDKEFRRILEAGFLADATYPALTSANVSDRAAAPLPLTPAAPGLFLRLEMDSKVYDGRFANNAWLQETADPITKLVWDNAAILSKKDADQLGVKHGDIVRIDAGQRSIEAAAFVQPGQPIGVIGLTLGYGRTAAGSVGDRLGFNAGSVRTSAATYAIAGVKVKPTGGTYKLATTHEHHILDEFAMRNALDKRIGPKNETGWIVREATLAEFKANPQAPHRKSHGTHALQLFNEPHKFNDPHAWGMAIDLNTCIGCNACVVACVAENNIPVVGKEQVLMHREMHWIRIDRYFKASSSAPTAADDPNPQVVHQPMLCVHCENAPCEQVCPVAATVHDTEGLNTMVYNRCIGTRYCSNNCPYKVRRFNYFDYHSKEPRAAVATPWLGMPDTEQRERVDQIKRLVYNPEVTVRMRGVMEKCTYCTQRLQQAKIAKRNAAIRAGNPQASMVEDGEVITACQQSCPTQAIVFGNLNDKKARVVELQRNVRAFDVLGELNTRPRTRFLAKLRNPADGGAAPSGAAHHG